MTALVFDVSSKGFNLMTRMSQSDIAEVRHAETRRCGLPSAGRRIRTNVDCLRYKVSRKNCVERVQD